MPPSSQPNTRAPEQPPALRDPVGGGVVEADIGAERLQPGELLLARGAGDHRAAGLLGELDAAGADAAREIARQLSPALLEARKQGVERLQPVGEAEVATRPQADLQILLDRQPLEDVLPLRHVARALPHDPARRQARDRLAGEDDGSPLRRKQADDQLEQGRLAGAVRADDHDELAFVDMDVDAVQDVDLR